MTQVSVLDVAANDAVPRATPANRLALGRLAAIVVLVAVAGSFGDRVLALPALFGGVVVGAILVNRRLDVHPGEAVLLAQVLVVAAIVLFISFRTTAMAEVASAVAIVALVGRSELEIMDMRRPAKYGVRLVLVAIAAWFALPSVLGLFR